MIKCDCNNGLRIKIYVACHKESYVPEHPYLYPIQVGAALVDKRMEGVLHDDVGDHISDKNKSYCELTAQYWAWKNEEADYYGFFHYRRYLVFDSEMKRDDGWGNISYGRITEEALDEIKLKPEIMRNIITNYDIIMVKGRRYPRIKEEGKLRDVYREYGTAAYQHRGDLDITLNILVKKYPAFKGAVQSYMSSSIAYECNMFIMKRNIYHDYCEWLFDILFEAEKQIDMSWYSEEEYRVIGYLSERLCGIYYTYLKMQQSIKIFELPKTLFLDTTPKQTVKSVYEEEVPIVLSANNKFVSYLDVVIQSIIANANDQRKYDIIILFNDITEKNQCLIKLAAKGKENISIRFVCVCEYFDSSKLFVNQHLSVETYYRLIIPEIMPGYHKILYLDCDMVVDYDIAELYDIEVGECVIGAVKDIDISGQANLKNGWEKYAVDKLKLDSPYDYFQAGVLIINLEALREIISSEEMIELALKSSWRCHDQDVLNMVCKNRVYYIPQRWNVMMSWEEPTRSRMQIMKMAPRELYGEYMEARKCPYIIHFAGYQKPWDVMDCDFASYFWKYAKLSSYYPILLMRASRCLADELSMQKLGIRNNRIVRSIVNLCVPVGSRRREVVKKIDSVFKRC